MQSLLDVIKTHTHFLLYLIIHSPLTSTPFTLIQLPGSIPGKTDMMLNTRPHAPVLTSVVCLATARGKDKRFSRTGRAIHILQLPCPSFRPQQRGRREREGEHAGWEGGREGGIEGGDKEGYERK